MEVNRSELDLVIPKYLRCKLTGELLPRPFEHVTDEKPRLKEAKGHSKTRVSWLDMWPPAAIKTGTRT